MRIFVLKKSTIIRVAVLAVVLVAAIVYSKAMLDSDVTVFQTGQLGSAINRVDTGEKEVALTFDTTFGEDQTEAILNILKQEGAQGTFAVMGVWANENPELFQEIAASGNELISHSMSHGRYADMTQEEVLADADAARTLLYTEAKIETSLIRPPYGATNDAVLAALEEGGYLPIRWSIDSMDWKGEGAQAVADNVLNNVQPGDIILFQNNSADTVQALPTIIQALKKMGYSCVNLSDLLLQENYVVDSDGVQSQAGAGGTQTAPRTSVAPSPTPSLEATEPSKASESPAAS